MEKTDKPAPTCYIICPAEDRKGRREPISHRLLAILSVRQGSEKEGEYR